MAEALESAPPEWPGSLPLDSTAALIHRVKSGDRSARDELAARYHPLLMRWAHGRLPAGSRALSDTADLVQMTLLRVLDRMGAFEPRREGAFLVYLRRTLLNLLRNEIRRSFHDPKQAVNEEFEDERASLLEEMVGREVMQSYEAALAQLPGQMREAVVLRLEFGFSHREIADAIGSPSPNAARMLVSRALEKLSRAMDRHR
ncbi:MAG: RNA polymerase sigma factor [Candidatus Eisenbacteria bacterium]|nr:sigma-70 family RNA polymerase sigma factor [Candidatus Eisenbacteria bacterium]